MDNMPGRFPPPPESGPPGFPPYGYAPRQPSHYPMDLGRILELTFSLFRFRWRTFLGIALLIMVPAWVVLAITGAAFYENGDWYSELGTMIRTGVFENPLPGLWPAFLVNFVVSALVGIATFVTTGALVDATAVTYSGGSASTSSSVRRSLGRLVTYVGVFLLTFLVSFLIVFVGVLIGLALFLATATDGRIQPGPLVFFGLIVFVAAFVAIVFVAIRFAFAVPVVMLESAGAMDALRRSWRLASGSTWRVLGYLFVFGLIIAVTGGLLSAVISLLINPVRVTSVTTFTVDPVRLAISTFISGVISSALAPIPAIGTALLYFDLRFRRGESVPQPGGQPSVIPPAPPLA